MSSFSDAAVKCVYVVCIKRLCFFFLSLFLSFFLSFFCVFSHALIRTTAARAKVVEDWYQDGGVLLMGYEMYRLLSLKKSFVASRKKKAKKPSGPVVIDLDEEDRQQELLKG